MVGAAFIARDHVIHGEVAKRECHAASTAATLLFSEKLMPVRPVARELAQVRPRRNVGAVIKLVEQPKLVLQT